MKDAQLNNMVSKKQVKLMEQQLRAALDQESLKNVELTLYINELRDKIRDLEDENRKASSIQNWKSYEELVEEVRKLIERDSERLRDIQNL